MADDYARAMLKISLAQICQNIGFQGGTNVSLAVLLDIYRQYMESTCRNLRRYCDHFGRSEPVLEDVEMMFSELRISVRELSDYVHQVAPVPFKHKVPLFPISRPSKLKIPPPDAEELETRPDYIHPHLPLLKPEPSPPPKSQEVDNSKEGTSNDEAAAGKLNAARISVHRATITLHGKQDLSQCGDLIADFSDFDAVKAGLIKFVRVPTPPPRSSTPVNPRTNSPSISAPTLIVKSSQPPMIKVAEEKSTKRKPTVLEVRPQAPKMASTLFPPHPKLKINLSSTAVHKKKLGRPPNILKMLKVMPPLESGVKKSRIRPVLDPFPPAAAVQLPKPIEPETNVEVEKKIDAERRIADVLVAASLDTSTASSSVEDLVTSVVEETHNKMKAQQKASEHFAASVNSVINSKAEPSAASEPPKLEEFSKAPLTTIGTVAIDVSKKETAVSIPELTAASQVPSTSAVKVAPYLSNQQILKDILHKSRKVMNKDVIKQRIHEKKIQKEVQEKKIRDVVEKSFPPIAKRQEEPVPAPVPAPPPVVPPSTPAPQPTPVAPSSAAPPAESPVKPPRRPPPGIPPTSIRPSKEKEKLDKPPILTARQHPIKPDGEKVQPKKFDLLPPLFQPEHVTKSIISVPAVEHRKVAPLVIPKPKSAADSASAASTISAPPKRPESTKLVIKLPHMKPALPAAADEKRKKRLHDDDKEKYKEKHKEKIPEPPVLKKEKEKKEKIPKKEELPSTSKTTEIERPTLKLKINIGKPKPPVLEKEKSKEKPKRTEPLLEPAVSSRASSSLAMDYDDIPRSLMSPPPRSPSARSKSPSHAGSVAGAGYESPPPRTPSPGGSSPRSPIALDLHGPQQKAKLDEEPRPPPAKKQRVEQRPQPEFSVAPKITIKTDVYASHQFQIPATQPKQQQQHQKQQHGDDNAWYCPVCNVPYQEGADMIACDSCDRWFHWICVGLIQAPPDEQSWYCQQCRYAISTGKKGKQKGNVIKKKSK